MVTGFGGGLDSDTDSPIVLTITRNGVDLLNHVFPDSPQSDQELGYSNLYEINVEGKNIIPEELDSSSIRIGIAGNDMWSPQSIFIWGERGNEMSLGGKQIIPLAIETNISTNLSTDSSEGVSSIPIRSVQRGSRFMRINRLFLLCTTRRQPDVAAITQGTTAPLEIRIVIDGRLVVLYDLISGSLEKSGEAGFFTIPVISPFKKIDLNHSSITIRVKGNDEWIPLNLFLFGLNDTFGRPEFMISLVHIPDYRLSISPGSFQYNDSNRDLTYQWPPKPLRLSSDGPVDDLVLGSNQVLSQRIDRLEILIEKLIDLQNLKKL
jgi:hypothetical protein